MLITMSRSAVRCTLLLAFAMIASVAIAGNEDAPGPGTGPYFRDDKGHTHAVREPLESNREKDWLWLRFPQANGPRVPISVRIENDLAGIPTTGVQNLLENALMSSGRFKLIDSHTESPNRRAGGARYTLTAQMVEYSPHKKETGVGGIGAGLIGGASKGLLGGVDVRRSTSEVAIAVRLIDVGTGEVLENLIVRGKSGNTNLGLGGLVGGTSAIGGAGVSSWTDDAAAAATRIAVNKASLQICRWFDGDRLAAR
jgi:hypothetical protein